VTTLVGSRWLKDCREGEPPGGEPLGGEPPRGEPLGGKGLGEGHRWLELEMRETEVRE
jgi:hypothetical protein